MKSTKVDTLLYLDMLIFLYLMSGSVLFLINGKEGCGLLFFGALMIALKIIKFERGNNED